MTSPYRPEGPYIHPRTILPELPSVVVTGATLQAILNGRQVQLPDFSDAPRVKVFAATEGQDVLVAICERVAGPTFKPVTVLYRPGELKL